MPKSKTYSNEDIESALKDITEKHISISQAAKDYNIPRKTLADRKNKRWNSDKVGHPTILTPEEESSLKNYIFYMASHAFPLNIKQIKGFAWALLIRSGREKQFKERGPTEKWWRGFKKRHPELSLRTPDSLDRGRSRMANENVVKSHFNTLKKTLQENGLLDNAEKIFNVDESGINMELRQGKVIVKRAQKIFILYQKALVTTLPQTVVSVQQDVLPPMIIYEKLFPSAPYKA